MCRIGGWIVSQLSKACTSIGREGVLGSSVSLSNDWWSSKFTRVNCHYMARSREKACYTAIQDWKV